MALRLAPQAEMASTQVDDVAGPVPLSREAAYGLPPDGQAAMARPITDVWAR